MDNVSVVILYVPAGVQVKSTWVDPKPEGFKVSVLYVEQGVMKLKELDQNSFEKPHDNGDTDYGTKKRF